MSIRKPCHMPFRKLIPPFTLTENGSIFIGLAYSLARSSSPDVLSTEWTRKQRHACLSRITPYFYWQITWRDELVITKNIALTSFVHQLWFDSHPILLFTCVLLNTFCQIPNISSIPQSFVMFCFTMLGSQIDLYFLESNAGQLCKSKRSL